MMSGLIDLLAGLSEQEALASVQHSEQEMGNVSLYMQSGTPDGKGLMS